MDTPKRIQLPDNIEDRLEFLGTQNDITAMEIGYITEHIFHYCTREDKTVDPETGEITKREVLIDPKTEEEITAYSIYNTVAIAAKKSYRSIEDYRYVAKNVPDHVVQRFPQWGRHHWKAMIPHAETEEELIALAEKMAGEADEYGGVMGVTAMRNRLKPNPLPKWERELNKLRKACQRLVDDPDAPEWLVGMCKTALKLSDDPIYHYPPVYAEDTFLQVPTLEALKNVTEISVEMKPPLP